MADIAAFKAAIIDAGIAAAKSSQGAMGAAMATAGLAQAPAGMTQPRQNLSDAAALSATAQNAMAGARDAAQALAELEAKFPTPDPPPATP